MRLGALISAMRERRRTLVVPASTSDRLFEQLREHAASYPLTVERRSDGDAPEERAELVADDGSTVSVDCADLTAPLTRESFDARFGGALSRVDRATFTSYDGSQMAAASREIEDRAWRFGRGSLHAGFQRVSTLATQERVYTDLATADLDVHAYAVPDAETPLLDGVTVHLDDDDEIARTWFVVYDGGGDDGSKCALVAEERAPGAFRGFWTYDPAVVDAVLSHLSSRYPAPT